MAKRDRRSSVTAGGRLFGGSERPVEGIRIIGGNFRGRKLHYSGDLRTRPMKDRLREAVFNLVGPEVRGTHAIDLFAGTGALAFEALSRGSQRATLIEQHRPTANIIRQNAAILGVESQIEIVSGNTFVWARREPDLGTSPWAVFCSPPYAFFVDRLDEMLELVGYVFQRAPLGSVFVVEADDRFDFQRLPDAEQWDVRAYPPAVVGIYRKR